MMPDVPVPVWIAAGIIVGLIVLALIGYGAGLWDAPPT